MGEVPIAMRTDGEKVAYISGYRAGINAAVILMRLYKGQTKIDKRVKEAGNGMADVLERAVADGIAASSSSGSAERKDQP